jgi:hypothetical protein
MHMKTLPFWLFIALDLTQPAAFAEPPAVDDQAAALVDLLQADKLTVAGVSYALTQGDNRDVLPQSVRDCLAGMDYSFARDLYVQLARKVMSPEEISAAVSYYRSRAGHLNLMLSLRQNREQLQGYPGLAEADAAGNPTEEEIAQMVAFGKSAAGQKIGQIHSGPESENLVQTLAEAMMGQCLKQP